ncbi:MAG: TonB-dependent receptor, partial [Candidatus Glassbacteria bacterium]
DLNALDLPSALRRVPGVTISRYNLVGSYGGAEGGAIFIRGQGSNRPGADIQAMVDGVPKFVGIWTHPLMDLLSVDRIESIDVYKSPQPVRLGNMTLGAVNLTTRRMHREGQRTDLTAVGGQENTYSLSFNHGGRRNNFDYYFGGAAKGSDGQRRNADGQIRNYWGRAGYRFSENWDAYAIVSASDNWADDPGPMGGPLQQRNRYYNQDFTLNLTLANQNDRTNGFVRFYADPGKINWEQTDQAGARFNTRTDWFNSGLRAQQNLMLSPATELTLGFDYDRYGGKVWEEHADPAKDLRLPEEFFSNTAVYAGLRHSITFDNGVALVPSAGLRYNRHNVFDDEAAPEAGLTLGNNRWNLYANYSRGFNYAGVYSVWFYNVAWHYTTDSYRDLKPERVNHYELGLKLNPSQRVSFDLSLFHDRGRDRIRFIAPPPPPPSFANVDRYEITGFEVSVSWSPVDQVSLFGGLTLLGKDPETMPQMPGYTVNLGGNFRFLRRWQLGLDLSAVDDRYVTNARFTPLSTVPVSAIPRTGSYVVTNARLAYYISEPGAAHAGSQLFLAVENLTGTNYEYLPGYPMPGATLFFGLTVDY